MNLVCFADERMSISRNKCRESALANGCEDSLVWKGLAPMFSVNLIRINEEILENERGAGYWLWKPALIYDELLRMPDNEILFYSDAGIEIIDNLNYIKDKMNREGLGIFLFSGRFKHVEWCKSDVIKYINHESLQMTPTQSGPLYSFNGYESFIQVQASNAFFRVTKDVKDFVKEWLLLCQMPGFIDDSPSKDPNYPTFAEHRHDQAILTCLQIKYKIPLHWFPSTTNMDRKDDFPSDQYPALFNHHRKRNNEW